MALETPPLKSYPLDAYGNMSEDWSRWFNKLWSFASALDEHGITANRPTKNLYIGRQWFDDTLGYPIYIKSVTAGVATWVNGTGTVI